MKKFFGVALIVLGLMGMILPILPGWLFMIPGVALLRGQRKSFRMGRSI